MEFITAVGRPEAIKTDAIVVGVHANGELTPSAKALDGASGGAINAAVKSGDMTGKRGASLPLLGLTGVKAPRVLLAGLGSKDDFTERAFSDAIRSSLRVFNGAAKSVTVAALDWEVKGRDAEWQACNVAIAARETAFRTDELKSKREPAASGADTVALLSKTRNTASERGLRMARRSQMDGVDQAARQSAANICTPSFLATKPARCKEWKLDVEVLEANSSKR